jgi:hypothetical protein
MSKWGVSKMLKESSFFKIKFYVLVHLDPDPGIATQINADPCGFGSGSAAMQLIVFFFLYSTGLASTVL